MPTVVITPPDDPVVSLEEAKAHLRVDHSDDDDYIESLVAAATGVIDGPAGWLGRALVTQTLEWRGDRFGNCDIRLLYPPIQSVENISVKYDDSAGAEQTADPSLYRLVGQPGSPRLALAYNQSWPSTRCQAEAVRVRYVAGYGGPEDVPAPIRHAVLLMASHWYANREPVNIGNLTTNLPMTVDYMLAPFRLYSF